MAVNVQELRIHRPAEVPAHPSTSGPWKRLCLVQLLLILGAGAYLAWRQWGETLAGGPPLVQVETLSPRQPAGLAAGEGDFTAAGWIKLPNYHPVLVTPLTEGRVEEILVIEGSRVEKDQLLARLYPEDNRLALAAAEAALQAAEANLSRLQAGFRRQEVGEARADVDRFQALAENAARELARSRSLHPSGAVSLADLQRDEAAAAAAAADLSRAQERLALVAEGYRHEEIQAAVAEAARARAQRDLARIRLEYCQVKSPLSGMVLERLASPGQWLAAGRGPLLSLYDPGDLEARIDVDQEKVARIEPGQVVEILTRAEPDKVHRARVILLEPKADQVKNIVRVKAKILEPAGGVFYPDMVIQARFRFSAKEEEAPAAAPELTVPAAAAVAAAGQTWLFLLDGGRARRVRAELGPELRGRRAVIQGAKAGDRVLVSGHEGLRDGAAVRVGN